MTEFREACYELTGFRIDAIHGAGTQYRLQSMYAEHPDDELRFQVRWKERNR